MSQPASQMDGTQSSQRRKSKLDSKAEAKKQKDLLSDIEQKAQDNKHEIIRNPGVKELRNLINGANQIHHEIQDIGVAIQDSKLIGSLGRMGTEWAKNQASNRQQYNSREFVDRLKKKFKPANVDGDNDRVDCPVIDWTALDAVASEYFSYTPTATFLCGPMMVGIKVKERRQRQPQQRRSVEEVQPIIGAGSSEREVQPELSKRCIQCEQRLESGGPVPYIKFFVHPDNFGETIENLHACAHLVSDGRAGIFVNADGELMIRKTESSEFEAAKGMDENTNVSRAIVKMDYGIFQSMIKKYRLKEPYFRFDPNGADIVVGAADEDEDGE